MRGMIAQALANGLIFKYILGDSWFASVANMSFIEKKKKFFIFDMQTNRLAAMSEAERKNGRWTRIDKLAIPNNKPVKVWLKDLGLPVWLTKQIFTNKDGATGDRFLVTNDLSLTDEQFTTIYKKRWSVEEYHRTSHSSLLRRASRPRTGTSSSCPVSSRPGWN